MSLITYFLKDCPLFGFNNLRLIFLTPKSDKNGFAANLIIVYASFIGKQARNPEKILPAFAMPSPDDIFGNIVTAVLYSFCNAANSCFYIR